MPLATAAMVEPLGVGADHVGERCHARHRRVPDDGSVFLLLASLVPRKTCTVAPGRCDLRGVTGNDRRLTHFPPAPPYRLLSIMSIVSPNHSEGDATRVFALRTPVQ